MKRTRLKSKEANKWLEKYNVNFSKKDSVELVQGDHKVLIINKMIAFFYYNETLLPTLKYLQENICLPCVTVDMGAIKFVVNGADIMRPGITKIEEFNKEDFVVIVDENNKKPLSVGIALQNSEEMKNSSSGKSIKNIHYVGDDLWNM